MKLSKKSKISIIISIVSALILSGFFVYYFSFSTCLCSGAELIPIEFECDTESTNKINVTLSNFGGYDGRINSITDITFSNETTNMSIAQVYVDGSIADFRLKINSGQTIILAIETQGWFKVGESYTLNIAYQSKKNCNRLWGTDKLLMFDFTY